MIMIHDCRQQTTDQKTTQKTTPNKESRERFKGKGSFGRDLYDKGSVERGFLAFFGRLTISNANP